MRSATLGQPVADVGPVDVVIIKFEGNRFTGEIAAAIDDLVRAGIVRLLDAALVCRDADGSVGSLEVGEMGPDLVPAFVERDARGGVGILDADDVAEVGAGLEPSTSGLLLVFENTWAARFAGAARRAGGHVVSFGRIPADEVPDTLPELYGDSPPGV